MIRRSAIAQALDQSTQTTSDRQAFNKRSGAGYRAAQLKPEVRDTALVDAFRDFVKTGSEAYGVYSTMRQSQGVERANEIIRKFSPDERRVAREQGVLLHQDDPYAMEAVNSLTGWNAAHEVDQEIQNEVAQGKIKKREDLDIILQTRRQAAAKAFAEMNGIDPEDRDFQRGFNANVTQRNSAVVDHFGRWKSEESQINAAIQPRSEVGSLLSDPGFLQRPGAGAAFTGYFNKGLASGLIPTTAAADKLLHESLQDVTARPGGSALLANIGDEHINFGGKPVKVIDRLGADLLENLKVRAAHYEQSTKAARSEAFHGQLSGIRAMADNNAALAELNKLHAQSVAATPTDVMTPELQAIRQDREQRIVQQRAETAQLQADIKKAQQFQVQRGLARELQERARKGEMVSTDTRMLPTTAETGTWRHEEAEAAAATQVIDEIDSWDLPDDQKTRLKLEYIKSDRKDGPYRKILNEWADRAFEQWQGAKISGDTQQEYPQLDQLLQLTKADPVSMSMLLDPQKAALAMKLNAMERYGLSRAAAAAAENRYDQLPQVERNKQDKDYSDAIKESNNPLRHLPAEMAEVMLTVNRGVMAITNNPAIALEFTKAFASTNTVKFGDPKSPIGAVFKTDILMNPNDVTSWKAGQEAVQAKLDAFIEEHPEVGPSGAFISTIHGQLYIQTFTGYPKPLYMQDIRDEHAKAAAKEREEAKQEQSDAIRQQQKRVTLDDRLDELKADLAETEDLPKRMRAHRQQ